MFASDSVLSSLSVGSSLLQLSVENPERFRFWDAIVLTAASPQQARLYEIQLERARQNRLLGNEVFTLVAPDPGGARIGSGGATLNALRLLCVALKEDIEGLKNKRILLIHSGGDSRRIPWANILGKLFIPFPLQADPDRATPTLFDQLLKVSATLLEQFPNGGMLSLSGDVLALFPAKTVHFNTDAVTVVTAPVPLDQAGKHGVIQADRFGRVTQLFQKADPQSLVEAQAITDGSAALLDTGIFAYKGKAFYKLLSISLSTDNPVEKLVNDGKEISLYEELAAALVPARKGWVKQRPLGDKLLEAFSGLALYHHRCDRLQFLHFGTTSEVLQHLSGPLQVELLPTILADASGYRLKSTFIFQSTLAEGVRVGANSLAIGCSLGPGSSVGNRCVVLNVHDRNEPLQLPDHVCIWHAYAKYDDGQSAAVYLCCGVDDNPKEPLERATFCGRSLQDWMCEHRLEAQDLWEESAERNLWFARLFPLQQAPGSLALTHWLLGTSRASADLRERWKRSQRCSLAMLHGMLDTEAIVIHESQHALGLVMRAMQETVHMGLERDLSALAAQIRDEAQRIRFSSLADQVVGSSRESGGERTVPESRALQMQASLLLAGNFDEEGHSYARDAFQAVQREVARATRIYTAEPVSDLRSGTKVKLALPVRFDIAGGWSDTPPYCLEREARVLNLAISLNGALPVGVEVEALAEPRWELTMEDLDLNRVIVDAAQIPENAELSDPFTLLQTALVLLGFGSSKRISQGIKVRTWSRVPKGSGLGTSSILGGALIQALQRLAGRKDDVGTVSDLVLVLEQRMTTGGGWQDQIGGLVPGVKYTSSLPTRPLKLQVDRLHLLPHIQDELQQRLVIAYSGIHRLAKNILQIVVGRYLAREHRVLQAIERLVALADEGRHALSLGHLDRLGQVMGEAWREHQHLDPHCSNAEVDRIFEAVQDFATGYKLAGAGGGGFMGILCKDREAARRCKDRLKELGGGIRVYDWQLA